MLEQRSYRADDVSSVLSGHAPLEELKIYHDLDSFASNCRSLVHSLSPNFLHTYAIKSNPLPFLLRLAVSSGLGLEAASLVELEMCVLSGCEARKIVFDSPAKTKQELSYALDLGVRINADNEEEVSRIAALIAERPNPTTSLIGLRVNPLIGSGKIDILSTSDHRSKFGIPLNEIGKKAVFDLFSHHAFLTGLHCHVGSMGCSMNMLAEGASTLNSLANEIELQSEKRITWIDIGGGLAVNMSSADVSPSFCDFSKHLRLLVPELFESGREILTEFGKSLVAKTAWAVSRVEYVKSSYLLDAKDQIAVIHAGADLFMRTAYAPSKFPLRLSVHARDGRRKESEKASEEILTDIVGPLCFSGDKLATAEFFPPIESGDFVVVHDVGGNSINLWSRHCSRQCPSVYGYFRKGIGSDLEFLVMKAKESLSNVLDFWNLGDVNSNLENLNAVSW